MFAVVLYDHLSPTSFENIFLEVCQSKTEIIDSMGSNIIKFSVIIAKF